MNANEEKVYEVVKQAGCALNTSTIAAKISMSVGAVQRAVRGLSEMNHVVVVRGAVAIRKVA